MPPSASTTCSPSVRSAQRGTEDVAYPKSGGRGVRRNRGREVQRAPADHHRPRQIRHRRRRDQPETTARARRPRLWWPSVMPHVGRVEPFPPARLPRGPPDNTAYGVGPLAHCCSWLEAGHRASRMMSGARVACDDALVAAGAIDRLRHLAEWSEWVPFGEATLSAPRSPGVYVVREGGSGAVIYVGMAGERAGRTAQGKPKGLRGRLSVHASGKAAVSGLGEAGGRRIRPPLPFGTCQVDQGMFVRDSLSSRRVG